MGIMDLFNGKKNAEKAAAEEEMNKAKALETLIENQKKAHEGMEWPKIQPLNPIKVANATGDTLDNALTPERMDEIGQLIYEPQIKLDMIKDFSLQEILFVLTSLEVFNAKSKFENYESNHRVLYNEVLSRVRDASTIYVLYDTSTNYPFLDHGFASIYLDKDAAEAAAAGFGKQFRKLAVRECRGENSDDSSSKKGFFDYLFYLGIERLIVDNGMYRAMFRRSEIVAPPNWADDKKTPPSNPALAFAMLDFIEEAKWPVKYEKREQVLKAKEMRMLSLARLGTYIVPIEHDGPAEVMEDGRLKFGKDSKLKFPIMKNSKGGMYLPVFTDGVEFARKFGKEGFQGAVFKFPDLIKFVQDRDGVVINPMGQNIMLQKDKMLEIEAAAAESIKKAQAAKAAKDAVSGAADSANAAMNDGNEHSKITKFPTN